jgi:hypothetical protein
MQMDTVTQQNAALVEQAAAAAASLEEQAARLDAAVAEFRVEGSALARAPSQTVEVAAMASRLQPEPAFSA